MGRTWLLAALLLPAACTYIQNPTPASAGYYTVAPSAPVAAPEDPLPASGPIRQPYTTYLRVTDSAGSSVGYVVRYDGIPAHVSQPPERDAPEGSMFVENREFKRIGFITAVGNAYKFRGRYLDELGQRPVEELLPRFFDQEDLTLSPLH